MLNYPVLSRKNHHGIAPPPEEYFPAQNKEKEKDLFLRHARFFKAMKKFRMPSLHGNPH
jgi:hypothetical protein